MTGQKDLADQIRQKTRELISTGAVSCAIGYERATDGVTSRPLFAYQSEDCDSFIFDQTCTHNLTRFLRDKRDAKKIAIVVKPCDARAINLLLLEKQLSRDKLFIIGVVCPGISQTSWEHRGQELQPRCQSCPTRVPPVYDFLVGDTAYTPSSSNQPYTEVDEMEAKTAKERSAFWSQQFSLCIRCYACRQICPACYCSECFVEQLDPLWVGIRIDPSTNQIWNLGRAFHLTGRCVSCDECHRACPVGIPLRLLNGRLVKEVLELFDFRAGESSEVTPPFATYKKDEKLGIGE